MCYGCNWGYKYTYIKYEWYKEDDYRQMDYAIGYNIFEVLNS